MAFLHMMNNTAAVLQRPQPVPMLVQYPRSIDKGREEAGGCASQVTVGLPPKMVRHIGPVVNDVAVQTKIQEPDPEGIDEVRVWLRAAPDVRRL